MPWIAILPIVSSWTLSGRVAVSQLRAVELDDLLGRRDVQAVAICAETFRHVDLAVLAVDVRVHGANLVFLPDVVGRGEPTDVDERATLDDCTLSIDQIRLADKRAWGPDGQSVTMAQIALHSLHHADQHQIMAVASYMSPESPPPFAAQFAEVTVDTETGQVTVDKLVMAVDSGVIVNPVTASGQIEGGMTQALGYAVCEEMKYDERGRSLANDLYTYKIFRADEMPALDVIFVETREPSHPFGVKAVAEIPMDGVAPAVANAVYDAVGVRVKELPLTPERVLAALERKHHSKEL